MNYNYIWLC